MFIFSPLLEEYPILQKYNSFCREYFPHKENELTGYSMTEWDDLNTDGVFERIKVDEKKLIEIFGINAVVGSIFFAEVQHAPNGGALLDYFDDKATSFVDSLYSYCILEYFKDENSKIFDYISSHRKPINYNYSGNMCSVKKIIDDRKSL